MYVCVCVGGRNSAKKTTQNDWESGIFLVEKGLGVAETYIQCSPNEVTRAKGDETVLGRA